MLENHLSRLLALPLQVWLYAGRKQGFFQNSYPDLAEYLGLRPQMYRSRIERQLKPALDELCEKDFLSSWRLDRGSEGELKVRFRASVGSVRSKTSSRGYLVRQLTEREIPEPEAHRIASAAEDPEEILSRLS